MIIVLAIFSQDILVITVSKGGNIKLLTVNKTFFELSTIDSQEAPFNFQVLKDKKAIILFNSASQ